MILHKIEDRLPNPQLNVNQPNDYPINISTYPDKLGGEIREWLLKFILKNLLDDTAIVYMKKLIQFDRLTNNTIADERNSTRTSISKAKNVWMTSLLCKPSMKRIFAIGEDTGKSQMDGNERSQLVGIIEVNSKLSYGRKIVSNDSFILFSQLNFL